MSRSSAACASDSGSVRCGGGSALKEGAASEDEKKEAASSNPIEPSVPLTWT